MRKKKNTSGEIFLKKNFNWSQIFHSLLHMKRKLQEGIFFSFPSQNFYRISIFNRRHEKQKLWNLENVSCERVISDTSDSSR